jgi:hypothetical protein
MRQGDLQLLTYLETGHHRLTEARIASGAFASESRSKAFTAINGIRRDYTAFDEVSRRLVEIRIPAAVVSLQQSACDPGAHRGFCCSS